MRKKRFLKYIHICQYVLFISALFPFCAFAQNNIADKLKQALSIAATNPDRVTNIIASIDEAEIPAQPDSVQFDYYYFRAYVDDINEDYDAKIAHLTKAKNLCECSQGIHSPVYVEVIWALGRELEAKGDTISAFEIYQAAVVQSIGLYSLEDDNVKWQYEEVEDKVGQWYKDKSKREQMIARRSLFMPRKTDYSEDRENDAEYYEYINGKKTILDQLQLVKSLPVGTPSETIIRILSQLYEDVKDNVVAKATIGEMVAQSCLNIGDFKKAEEVLLTIIADLEKANMKHTKSYRRSLSYLGSIYNYLQNPDKARNYCGKAKYMFEHYLDFSAAYVLCLLRCASLEEKANRLFTQLIMTDVAIQEAYRIINSNAVDRARYYAAQDLCELLSSDALAYLFYGYNEEAISLIKQSISLTESLGSNPATQWANLADIYIKSKQYVDATSASHEAYRLCETFFLKVEIGLRLLLCEYLSGKQPSIDIAIKTSKLLKDQTEEMFSFMSTEERFEYWKHFELYTPLLNWIIYEVHNDSSYGTVYDNILQTKGLLLRHSNKMRDAVLSSNNEEYLRLYNNLLALKQQLIVEAGQDKRKKLRTEIEKIEKYFARELNQSPNQAHDITWESIHNKLTEGEITIEFYNIPLITKTDTIEGEPRYCAVVLKKDYEYPKIIPLCKESELQGLEQEDLYETDTIYRLIWQPLENEMANVTNVYFSADRELHRIGIEYAMTPNKSRIDDKYNMYRLSSTRIIAEDKSSSKDDKAVLFGGLRYDLGRDQLIAESRASDFHQDKASRAVGLEDLRYGVNYLPGTKEEVESISKIFNQTKKEQCKIVTAEAGTEESFRALSGTHVDIIHLATHGFFWNDDEVEKRNYVSFLANASNSQQNDEDAALLHSGLLFSGANIGLAGEALPDDVEDGVLTAQELSSMNLGNVDLVVLSACQSGLGEVTGEGVFGLQRGFKLAGANTLLMTLWKVEDEVTKELMINFYRHYLYGTSKRESLRLAQKAIRKAHPNPEYWAAFILLDGTD